MGVLAQTGSNIQLFHTADVQLCTRGRCFYHNITCSAHSVNWNWCASVKEQGASSSLISIKLNLQGVHFALQIEESYWHSHLNPRLRWVDLLYNPVYTHHLLGGHWHSLKSTATLLLCHSLLWTHMLLRAYPMTMLTPVEIRHLQFPAKSGVCLLMSRTSSDYSKYDTLIITVWAGSWAVLTKMNVAHHFTN